MATQLQIPAPCHEKWSEMTHLRSDCRHCAACDRQILDFTLKTDAELLQYIRQNSGKICGRFRTDQLGRPLMDAKVVKRSGLTAVAASVAALLTAQQVSDQPALTPAATHQQPLQSKELLGERTLVAAPPSDSVRTISGKVLDEQGEPLMGALVIFSNSAIKVISDAEGHFTLQVPLEVLKSSPLEIQLKYADFIDQTVPLPSQILQGDLSLLPSQTQMKEDDQIMGVITFEPSFEVDIIPPEPVPLRSPSPIRRFFQKLF